MKALLLVSISEAGNNRSSGCLRDPSALHYTERGEHPAKLETLAVAQPAVESTLRRFSELCCGSGWPFETDYWSKGYREALLWVVRNGAGEISE